MGLVSRESMDMDDITSSVQATYLHKVVIYITHLLIFLVFKPHGGQFS